MKISLSAQIEEVLYELGQRKDVYGRLVASNKMRESLAALHTQRMEAVLTTLQWLQANESVVRAAVAAAKKTD